MPQRPCGMRSSGRTRGTTGARRTSSRCNPPRERAASTDHRARMWITGLAGRITGKLFAQHTGIGAGRAPTPGRLVLLRLHVNALDIAILAVYFMVVVGIGVLARRSIVTSEDFLLSGRSL